MAQEISKKMGEDSSPLPEKPPSDEQFIDSALRPKNWADYVGQENIKENIKVIIAAAKGRGGSPDHLLLYGNSGLGKTTLAQLVALEMGKKIRMTSGPAIERAGDLAAILTNLQEGDVLFLDEIHRIHKTVEEYIYPAMEEYKLNLITKGISEHALPSLEVDRAGLEPGDIKILQAMIEKFDGGPVGLQSLAAAALEEEDTILDMYEPYLMQCGFIER